MLKRREFLKVSAAGLGTMLLPIHARAAGAEPHFFLQIYVYGGIDSLFMFDARPQLMTAKGHVHAYINEDPRTWVGRNGVATWASSLTDVLRPLRDEFSIVNGVHMTTSFDGHLQNVNFLYTGNPFGGESFIPHLNSREPRPLDAIQQAEFALDLTNGQNSVPLSFESAHSLVQALKRGPVLDASHPAARFLEDRFMHLGEGEGLLSRGSSQLHHGFKLAPGLARRLSRLELREPGAYANAEQGFIDMLAGFFREGICSSAILQISSPPYHLDVHAASLARHQPEMYRHVANKVAEIFQLLRATPFDDERSLWDVTTVMFASEFGRTLRQPGLPLDETGTDHNSLNNSILIGGKGIRGGLVLGETDWRTPEEPLSGAHQHLDAGRLKFMGKPFDFETGRARTDLPTEFKPEDYLNIASVINTVYSLFDVPTAKWRTVKRDGPRAPVLRQLLL